MTPSEFKVDFPTFVSTSDDAIAAMIAKADPYFDVCRWGAFYSEGLGYWVAHKLVLANVAAGQGISGKAAATDIVNKAVGDVSVGRDSAMLNLQAKDPFMRTVYGQEYKALALRVGTGAITL